MVEIGFWVEAEEAVAYGGKAVHASLYDGAYRAGIHHCGGSVHTMVDARYHQVGHTFH